jgi:isopenicillin N synthase-like dioxygenase
MADYGDVGAKLKEAFSKIGFVYLFDHGIEQDIIDRWVV